jgi:sec-independent protein translocase protein TatB
MEILGIGPGEFILIMVVLLVVVGPERLPDLARQAGRLVVQVRNWMQKSPDAALVLRARQEIEQELAVLKSSLVEVQNVRDEVLGAARQIEDSVGSLTSSKLDLDNLLRPPPSSDTRTAENGQSPTTEALADSVAPPEPEPSGSAPTQNGQAPVAEALADSATPPEPEPADSPRVVLEKPLDKADDDDRADPPAQAPTIIPTELESINLRLQAIMSDLFALQEQLKQRGVLGADWQPPSFTMHLPVESPAPADGTPVETEEAT